MSDELRAAEALAALRLMAETRIEYKTAIEAEPLAIHDRTVTTLFSVDNLDRVGDITPPSAFTKSIQERGTKIPHLLMHDERSPAIARILSFAPVPRDELPADVRAEYPEATGGMSCRSLFLKNARAEEVFEGIQAGLYGASFAYRIMRKEQKTLPDGRSARILHEVKLLEVSSVHTGMEANGATRSQLARKALDAMEGAKAGRRHSRADEDMLNNIIAIARMLLGEADADEITEAIDEASEGKSAIVAAPLVNPARTTTHEALVANIRSVFARLS